MVISATFSKASKECESILGRPYLRAKIKLNATGGVNNYSGEFFTEKQAFHQQFTEEELNSFIEKNAGTVFKNAVIRTDEEEITVLSNKKGKITRLVKKIKSEQNSESSVMRILNASGNGNNRRKNYLIQEGKPVPFLVFLGVMSDSGKVISSRYDKFRQINRFLEFIDDVVPELEKLVFKDGKQIRPLRVRDFGCGKSYLTFAVHYFLTEIRNLEVQITGLDLKKDVIEYCNKTALALGCKGLNFDYGNIADYSSENLPDMVITLHACDTATDFALDYAVRKNCPVILSVPCCQHELNGQLDENLRLWKKSDSGDVPSEFNSLLKYGLIKERFASLLTDSIRCEFLEKSGYGVQVLEFIDMENTPKNLLIRAVKGKENPEKQKKSEEEALAVIERLKLSPSIKNLLG